MSTAAITLCDKSGKRALHWRDVILDHAHGELLCLHLRLDPDVELVSHSTTLDGQWSLQVQPRLHAHLDRTSSAADDVTRSAVARALRKCVQQVSDLLTVSQVVLRA